MASDIRMRAGTALDLAPHWTSRSSTTEGKPPGEEIGGTASESIPFWRGSTEGLPGPGEITQTAFALWLNLQVTYDRAAAEKRRAALGRFLAPL